MWKKLKVLGRCFRYDERDRPFLEHLEDLRKTVIRMAVSLLAGMLLCLPFADRLIAVLRAPAKPYIESMDGVLREPGLVLRIPAEVFDREAAVQGEGGHYYEIDAEAIANPGRKVKHGAIRLQFSEPAAALKMWLAVSFFGGLLLSSPFLALFLVMFVLPGLRNAEKKVIWRVAGLSGGLFLLGMIMGYKVTLPLALGLMLKVGGQLGGESIWFYNKYIAFALQLLLAFGLAFQLPVAILVMGRMGLVGSRQLREKRRHVIVGVLVAAMALTPPDVMTQLLLAGPLILLYEFCIWFLHYTGNRETTLLRKDAGAADGQLGNEPDEKRIER